MRYVKCVVVGDGAVGKTSLIVTYIKNAFPGDYVPTDFDSYSTYIMAKNQTPVDFHIWDTVGQDEFKKTRPVSYPNTDVLLICFSLVLPDSLENVVSCWVPEVHEFCPNIPYLLVGLKSDLRDCPQSDQFEPISDDHAKMVADQIGAAAYISCSALNKINLSAVFEMAADIALDPPNVQKEQAETCFIV